MNRIVLIGNGFDKAHNLPTGYCDFMNYLTDSIAKFNKKENSTYELITTGKRCGDNRTYYHKLGKDGLEDNWIGVKQLKDHTKFKLAKNPHKKSIYFESLFADNDKLGYWSDLESHYFKMLYKHRTTSEDIALINSEFEHLKELIRDYLKIEVEAKTGITGGYEIPGPHSIYNLLGNEPDGINFEKTHIVTFNYTSKILNDYLKRLIKIKGRDKFPISPIHIHGDLNDPGNPIIFGYGDENSKEYHELELLLDNDLLKNFKTFQYLRTGKYKEVLGLLEETDDIYVQLIGHSSGLCDKALLRAIFQHENVKRIEATYYSDESKYFENLYNISRVFDDNTVMRKKLVPLSDTCIIE